MQMDRLFGIIYLLLDKRYTTANELAERFEVSRRTILRDIDTLTLAGIPIYTVQGKGGGISLLNDYVLNKTTISKEEQNQILFGLQGLAVTGNIDADDLLKKLGLLFNADESNWIEVDFSPWGNEEEGKRNFEILKESIIQTKVLSMTYYNTQGEMIKRKVYPIKLLFKSKSWYLQAYCLYREAYRIFKISRMRDLVLLEENFEITSLESSIEDAFQSPKTSIEEIKLLCDVSTTYRIYDEFLPKDIHKNADGTFLVTMRAPIDQWIFGYILSYGNQMEVIEPISLRQQIIAHIEQMKKNYK